MGQQAVAKVPALQANQSASQRLLGVLTPAGVVMAGILTIAFLAMFFRFFVQQHRFSSNAFEDWGHAYIVPIISLALLAKKKDQVAALVPRFFAPGLGPFVLGLVSYVYFAVFLPNHMLQGGAIVLCLLGVVLTLFGPVSMRCLFIPIAFLGFGITISEAIMINITFQLQILASEGAYVLLTVIGAIAGFSVLVDGTVLTVISSDGIETPLNVAEACSGMRMVVAFVMLSAAAALFGTRMWGKRVAIVLLGVPVSLFMNIIRVAVLGLLSLVDPDLAVGDAHSFIGMLLLFPALGLFIGTIWALNKVIPEEQPTSDAATGTPSGQTSGIPIPTDTGTDSPPSNEGRS